MSSLFKEGYKPLIICTNFLYFLSMGLKNIFKKFFSKWMIYHKKKRDNGLIEFIKYCYQAFIYTKLITPQCATCNQNRFSAFSL